VLIIDYVILQNLSHKKITFLLFCNSYVQVKITFKAEIVLTKILLNLLLAQIIYFALGLITNYSKKYCQDCVIINIGTWQTCEETPAENANVILHLYEKDSLSI